MDSDSQLDWSLFLEDNPAAKDLLKDTTCTTDGSSTDDNDNENDEDAAYYSSLFQLYDGNWAVNGHWLTERMGSMLECLQSSSYFDFDEDHDNYHESSSSLNESCSEFFYLEDYLPLDNHHKYDELQQLLQCRNLAMASLMIRCLAADLIAPPYVPIRRLSPSQRRTVAELKRQANEAFFFQNDHATALHLYDQALQQYFTPQLICSVMPVQDLKELVTLLASQADCYFQLQDFPNVGYLASYALVFDATHTKARILRAKAELALARIAVLEERQAGINDDDHHESLRYTLQAKMDLEQVLSSFGKNNNKTTSSSSSRAEETVARELMEDVVQPMLQRERKRVVEGNDGIVEWNSHVKNITATCWQTHNLFLTTTTR